MSLMAVVMTVTKQRLEVSMIISRSTQDQVWTFKKPGKIPTPDGEDDAEKHDVDDGEDGCCWRERLE